MSGCPCSPLLRQSLVWLLCLFLLPALANGEPLLTREQQHWLAQHPVIRVAVDPSAAPFEWITEEGAYRGISAELLEVIGTRLGIGFEVLGGKDWADTLNMVREHQADLLTGVVRTEERETYLTFTQPYLKLPGVIISAQTFNSVEALAGHKVAVVKDSIWDERIAEYDDQVSIVRVEDTRTALDLTALGGVDAMVSNLATVTYHIGKEGFANLNIVGRVRDQGLALSLGVRNDWPELVVILQQALNDISAAEIDAIKTRWTSIDERGFTVDPFYAYLLLGILLLTALSLGGFIAWNRSLKHRVEVRTRELTQTQECLAEARKMESIAQLALGVAHEIKNPLAIMQMGIDFLAQDDRRDETEQAVLGDIDTAVCRAAHIVQSLQIFSRREQVSTAPCDLNTVIEEVVAEHADELSDAGIETRLELDDDLAPFPMDRKQLRQALGCLVRNARQAMSNGGVLSIGSRRKTLRADDLTRAGTGQFSAGEVTDWVEIKDTGTGISEPVMDKIFNPFFTTLPQGEGFGLGLPIAQNIVKLHNGTVDVRNRPEGGVSVVLKFKLKQGEL